MKDPLVELDELEKELDALAQRGDAMPEMEFERAVASVVARLGALKKRKRDQSYGARYVGMLEEEKQMITQRVTRRGAEQPEYYRKTPFWGIDKESAETVMDDEDDEDFIEDW